MKLEFKHLASYLEHKVILSYIDCLTKRKRKAFLSGMSNKEIETTYLRKIKGCSGDYISWDGNNNIHDLQVKPILFPLSSLTKDDVKNFYQFNNDDFKSIDLKEWAEDLMFFIKTKEPFQLSQFEYLLSKKFDVFGLIELGLAEPVTEDFNPYK